MGLSAGLLMSQACAKTSSLQWRDTAMVGLGTTLSLRAAHADGERARAGLDAAVAAIRHVEAQMSLFNPDSALSTLNREGVLYNPHPDLVRVLRLAQQVSAQSQGTFDVTVQPLWLAWAAAQREGRLGRISPRSYGVSGLSPGAAVGPRASFDVPLVRMRLP